MDSKLASVSRHLVNPEVVLRYLTSILGFFILYSAALVIFRLWLSPLAKFPGPKLAAMTLWYETYYEIVKDGQYFKKIQQLHEQYGPIVRIAPNELHIRDSSYFDTYNLSKNLSKDEGFYHGSSLPLSAFQTYPPELHRKRRGAMNPYFSHANIESLSPAVTEKTNQVCEHLEASTKSIDDKDGNIVDVSKLFQSMTMDIISHCAFGESYNSLEKREISEEYARITDMATKTTHYRRLFPLMRKMMDAIPLSILKILVPELGSIQLLQDAIAKDVKEAFARNDGFKQDNGDKKAKQTIFHQILNSGLPAEELSSQRLVEEGVVIVSAGFVTTAHALSIGTYHLCLNPTIVETLREELKTLLPHPNSPLPNWTQLERVPYLAAVVKESLRMSWGTSTRIPRISPTPFVYKNGKSGREYVIPANVVCSMSTIDVSFDPEVFPQPWDFDPQRWLDEDGSWGEKARRLDKYFVIFNKGPRNCLGMWLAYAELYTTIAAIVRRFDLELRDTDERDVIVVRDYVVPFPEEGRGAIKVVVKNVVGV